MAWTGLGLAMMEGDARLAFFILMEEIRGRQPPKKIAETLFNHDGPAAKIMTAFAPASWQKKLVPADRNAAPTGRWCPEPKNLSTMQMNYLRIRTLAFGAATPKDGQNEAKKPMGP